ncbi:MAG TPA: methyltransferase [Coriobacteriia bacterium]|nr:methyltransferase [Coriobacteriia bacterium]
MMAILNGKQPDYYGDFMDAMALIPDPAYLSDRIAQDGEIHKDSWGVEFVWTPGTPGKHPVERPGHLAINDIERWQKELKVPDLDNLDWSEAKKKAAQVDRNDKFLAVFNTAGIFERSHHLMGLEEALVNYMIYQDEMAGVLRAIADFKIKFIHIAAEELGIDAIFYQDDWGTKTNLFLPPEVWRKLIKPLHTEIVAAAHEHGILFVHHADCFCQPVVEDMLDMNIDIWQGTVPQNDIVEIQRITGGKLPMVGGIDGPAVDTESATEEAIRAEVRRAIDTYCPAGRFFPSSTRMYMKNNQAIMEDELAIYGRQWALDNPRVRIDESV